MSQEERTPEEIDGDMRLAVAFMATVLEQIAGTRHDPTKPCTHDTPKSADALKAAEVLERPAVALSIVAARSHLEDSIKPKGELH